MRIIGRKVVKKPQVVFQGTCKNCGVILLADNEEVKEVTRIGQETEFIGKCPKCEHDVNFEVHIFRTLYRRLFC